MITKQPLCDALVEVLQELGVRYLFGVSGANIEHIHDAVVRCGKSQLSNVLCKSEFAAAFSANAYARHAQSIGVCCATSGGGMMNLAVGVAEAQAAHVPVLALVGCPAVKTQNQGGFQDAQGGTNEVDGQQLWQAISKYSQTLNTDNFWHSLYQAISSLINDTPGPSALLIPRDVMECPVAEKPQDWPSTLEGFRHRRSFDEERYHAFRNALKHAQRPVLIAGAQLFHSTYLATCAEKFLFPVACTLESTGVLAHEHPQFAGMIGVAGHASTHALVANSDLVIVCGGALGVMDRAPIEEYIKHKTVWVINHYLKNVPHLSSINVLAMHAEDCLQMLIQDETLVNLRYKNQTVPCIEYFMPAAVSEQSGTLQPQALLLRESFKIIQSYLGHFNNLLFDAGNCAAAAAHYLRIPEHSNSYIALGMAGMGYAVCAVIGAQLASMEKNSEATSLVICGDGAFLIAGTEVNTAIDKQLGILWVICNDSQHGMCSSRQKLLFESRVTATRYPAVNFSLMARALANEDKLWVARATTYCDIEKALGDYCARPNRGPGVLEIITAQDEIPPFTPINAAQSQMC